MVEAADVKVDAHAAVFFHLGVHREDPHFSCGICACAEFATASMQSVEFGLIRGAELAHLLQDELLDVLVLHTSGDFDELYPPVAENEGTGGHGLSGEDTNALPW